MSDQRPNPGGGNPRPWPGGWKPGGGWKAPAVEVSGCTCRGRLSTYEEHPAGRIQVERNQLLTSVFNSVPQCRGEQAKELTGSCRSSTSSESRRRTTRETTRGKAKATRGWRTSNTSSRTTQANRQTPTSRLANPRASRERRSGGSRTRRTGSQSRRRVGGGEDRRRNRRQREYRERWPNPMSVFLRPRRAERWPDRRRAWISVSRDGILLCLPERGSCARAISHLI